MVSFQRYSCNQWSTQSYAYAPLTPAANPLMTFKLTRPIAHLRSGSQPSKDSSVSTCQMSLAAFRPTVHPFSSRGMLLFHAVGCVLMLSPMGFRIRIALIVECKPDYKKIILQSRQSYQYLKCQWKSVSYIYVINVISATSSHVVIDSRNGEFSTLFLQSMEYAVICIRPSNSSSQSTHDIQTNPANRTPSIRVTALKRLVSFYLSDVPCCFSPGRPVCCFACVSACIVVGVIHVYYICQVAVFSGSRGIIMFYFRGWCFWAVMLGFALLWVKPFLLWRFVCPIRFDISQQAFFGLEDVF